MLTLIVMVVADREVVECECEERMKFLFGAYEEYEEIDGGRGGDVDGVMQRCG